MGVREGCINCGTEEECTCFIFSVWTAPGQGLISNLPLCLLFLISLPAWTQLCLSLFYLPTSDFLLHAYTLIFLLNPLCSTSQTLSWFLFCSVFLLCPWFFDSLAALPFSSSLRVIWGIHQQTWSRAQHRSALLCWNADKRHCLATLPQACIFQINRCSFTHKHTRTHKPSSFIDVPLQSAQLLRNFSTAELHSNWNISCFYFCVLKQSIFWLNFGWSFVFILMEWKQNGGLSWVQVDRLLQIQISYCKEEEKTDSAGPPWFQLFVSVVFFVEV